MTMSLWELKQAFQTVEHSIGGKGEEVQWRELDWLKHNACTGEIPRQKSHWTMNTHLNNGGQECKIDHTKERAKER
jgi:hypothetical protein